MQIPIRPQNAFRCNSSVASEIGQTMRYASEMICRFSNNEAHCAFLAFANFLSRRLFVASGPLSVSRMVSHHLNELE